MKNIIVDNDLLLTMDLALFDYVSDSQEIETYVIDTDSVELEENGDIVCSVCFDGESAPYTAVLHDGNIYIYR